MIEETQPAQSKEGIFLDKGFRKGQIFKRKNCFDYDSGYGCYTGEYYENCDGIVMKFYDGGEFLSDFCEVVTKSSDEIVDVYQATFLKLREDYKTSLQNILNELNKIE